MKRISVQSIQSRNVRSLGYIKDTYESSLFVQELISIIILLLDFTNEFKLTYISTIVVEHLISGDGCTDLHCSEGLIDTVVVSVHQPGINCVRLQIEN